MKALGLQEAASVVGGEIAGDLSSAVSMGAGRLAATGVKTDSREVTSGDIYVARKGEFLDGHDYLAEAFLRGAVAAIVEREMQDLSGPQIVVRDSMRALRDLAAFNRDVIDPIVVGITGSTGKTSTKDLIASVAAYKFSTIATERSYNAEVGVPLTLLRAGEDTELVVVEMGSRDRGHIAELCQYARPHVGVVTNVGLTHFEQFGSRSAIAESKGELIEVIEEAGTAVLNADDPLVRAMSDRTKGNVITFGYLPEANVRAERIELDRLGRASFRLMFSVSAGAGGGTKDSTWLTLSMSGAHQVINALAAAAAGVALGIPMEGIRVGLESAVASPWRMEVREVGGILFVNDAYNANPNSMASALDTCSSMAVKGRLIAVLGYMAELGEIAEEQHLHVGELAAAKASRLIVVGEKGASLARGARSAGMRDVREVADATEVLEELSDLSGGDVVLVKASRAAGLEALVNEVSEVFQK